MSDQQTTYAEAVAAAGQVYAEAIARPAREAARETLGKAASEAELQAWMAEFRSAGRG